MTDEELRCAVRATAERTSPHALATLAGLSAETVYAVMRGDPFGPKARRKLAGVGKQSG